VRINIVERRRGTPLDKLVAELMIAVNSTWGSCSTITMSRRSTECNRWQGQDDHVAMAHLGLGISHYAWTSSPLRRYVDLVNQWQLLALLDGRRRHFRSECRHHARCGDDFETTYASYDEISAGAWSITGV